MALTTPTTATVYAGLIAQIQTEMGVSLPLLPKSFIRVLAKALAGVFILLYRYGVFTHQQLFVSSASFEETEVAGRAIRPLVEWGRLVGAGDPHPATRAELFVEFSVVQTGGGIMAGTNFLSADNGVTYYLVEYINLSASTVAGRVRAVSDQSAGGGYGTAGNLTAGAVLTFAVPRADVSRNVTVTGLAVEAVDGETEDAYRRRVLGWFQQRPQGGAYADYVLWAGAVPGVANAYPYTSEDPGQVEVYIEADATDSNPGGVPSASLLSEVAAAIEADEAGRATRRPAGALVSTLPISRTEFSVRVSGLEVDGASAVRAEITAALGSFFLSREPYIVGLSVLPRADRVSNTAVAGVVDDIVTASGGVFTQVSVTQGGSGVEIYTLGVGEKAILSGVSFV